MEPVRKPLPAGGRRLLLLLAVLFIMTAGALVWRQSFYPSPQPPVTATEFDARMLATGGEAFVQLPAPSPNRKLTEAQEALTGRRPLRALSLAAEMLAADPGNADALIIRVRAYFLNNEMEQAAKAIAEVLKVHPDLPEAYLYRGHLFKARKLYAEAAADYSRAISLNPAWAAAYYHRGDVSLLTGKLDAARDDFTAAIDRQRGSVRPLPTPYFKRGRILYLQREHKAAIKDLSRAVELAPSMYEAYLYRANALAALGRFETAIHDYDTVLKLKPDTALAYYGRALVWREKGDAQKAAADFLQAEKLGVKRPRK
ncbi:MAG: tetratricopeptide repeat protein [Sporomusaceae bacterium]|nr:tetratricopeptide repeat protein [Sporomusaceae bacterium]